MGVLVSESPESIREAAAIVARWVALANGSKTDADARKAAQRELAFDELAAAHPVVVEDGTALLASLSGLAGSLSQEERSRIVQVLGRRDLPPRLGVALIQAIATQRLTELLPALRDLKDPPATVLAASWDAQRQLGSPPSAASLVPFLAAHDPAIRAVAAPALLATGDRDAVPRVERLVRDDPEASVRTAATEALGRVKAPGGLVALERIYSSSAEQRTAAGNAILAWGGDEAADTLTRLAFEAPPEAQKSAVTLIFALGRTQNDPRIVRIRTTHPDPTVRELVEHGFDLGTERH
jgi:HEAT repeat protein